ncbi:MAG: hypothetical protein QOE32_1135, partial [Pseudonocardiales bacterium]|nr:hypothetical protein [Pseudonocardiales bacterium]
GAEAEQVARAEQSEEEVAELAVPGAEAAVAEP